jgi:outer membrane biosynthesis protein TonB
LGELKKALNKDEKQEQKQEEKQEVKQEQQEQNQDQPVEEEKPKERPSHHEDVADEEAIEPPKKLEKQPESEVKEIKKADITEAKSEIVQVTPVKAKEVRFDDNTTGKKTAASTNFTSPSATKNDYFNTPQKRAFDAGSPIIGNHYRYKSAGRSTLTAYEANKDYLDYVNRIQRSSPKRTYYY